MLVWLGVYGSSSAVFLGTDIEWTPLLLLWQLKILLWVEFRHIKHKISCSQGEEAWHILFGPSLCCRGQRHSKFSLSNAVIAVLFPYLNLSFMCCFADLVLSNKLVVYDLENQVIGWTEYNCKYHVTFPLLYMDLFFVPLCFHWTRMRGGIY